MGWAQSYGIETLEKLVFRRTLLAATASGLMGSVTGLRAATRLRIGLTAVILADQAAFLARWADYLGQRTGNRVSFAVRDEYQAILEQLAHG